MIVATGMIDEEVAGSSLHPIPGEIERSERVSEADGSSKDSLSKSFFLVPCKPASVYKSPLCLSGRRKRFFPKEGFGCLTSSLNPSSCISSGRACET